MLGGFALLLGAFGAFDLLTRNDFGQLDEEATLRHDIEDVNQFLLLVFYQFVDVRVAHHPAVNLRIVVHLFECDFLFLFPVVIADEEGGDLVVRISYGFDDGFVEVVEGGFRVYLYFAEEAFCFVRDEGESVYHCLCFLVYEFLSYVGYLPPGMMPRADSRMKVTM